MIKQQIKKILVPLDGSKNSLRGLKKAIYLAKEHKASLAFIHVLHHIPKSEGRIIREIGITSNEPTFLLTAMMLAKKNGVPSSDRVVTGDPGHAIVDYSHKHNIDLIVIGARGLGTYEKIFLGSVSSYVMQKAKTDVMVIK